MGKKIFISYKYADTLVKALPGIPQTTARDYVDKIQSALAEEDHINQGEKDDEDLSDFKEDTIASKLRDKIYRSSITIVLITRGMKQIFPQEKDQWIPWEISYSLKEHTRDGRISKTNAVLAVIIPDSATNYEYFYVEKYCPHCNTTLLRTDILFQILRENMFNAKAKNETTCSAAASHGKSYKGEHSYILSVKWDEFMQDINKYIDRAVAINENIENYDVVKIVK